MNLQPLYLGVSVVFCVYCKALLIYLFVNVILCCRAKKISPCPAVLSRFKYLDTVSRYLFRFYPSYAIQIILSQSIYHLIWILCR